MMNTSALPVEEDNSKIIKLKIVDGGVVKKEKIKYNIDGSIKKTHCNKQSGVSSEVYAFRTKEEISKMINILNKHIEEADNENQKQIAYRNKMLFMIGINIGIRASDIRKLRYNFFYNSDGSFKEFYSICPKKTEKHHKFVKLFFNQTVKKSIEEYTQQYPIEDYHNYLFPSRKGDEAIQAASLWRIIKDTALEAGINQNIGSHSLRKTFAYWIWHEADDKNKALVMLQIIFNHASTIVTSKYIGIINDELSDMCNDIELGLEFI